MLESSHDRDAGRTTFGAISEPTHWHWHALFTAFVAAAALSKGQQQIRWHAQHFHKVGHRLRGRHRSFARSGTDFSAGAAISQGR